MAMKVQIRAKIDNLTTDQGKTVMAGDVTECSADRAKVLVARGHAEIVSGDVTVPGPGGLPLKGDVTERAENRAAKSAETQTKKG